METKAFLARVQRTIEQYDMLTPGEPVLAALSGGADSVALLREDGDYLDDKAQESLARAALTTGGWRVSDLRGLERPDRVSYLTKYRAAALGGRAQIAWKSGREQDAETFLREALALADRFDAAPNYRADALRWYEGPDTAMAYDSMGATAQAAVRQAFTQQGEDPEADAFLTAFESEN